MAESLMPDMAESLVPDMAESLVLDMAESLVLDAISVSVLCVGRGMDMTMTTKILRNLGIEYKGYSNQFCEYILSGWKDLVDKQATTVGRSFIFHY